MNTEDAVYLYTIPSRRAADSSALPYGPSRGSAGFTRIADGAAESTLALSSMLSWTTQSFFTLMEFGGPWSWLPYMQNGNLGDYIRKNHAQLDDRTKETWIRNAANAIEFIHSHSVIHGDISARNFLVADDLSIKLCDFAGSAIHDLRPFVEEDRYQISPLTRRTFKTDLIALGCLIYELSTGSRPYQEIEDTEEVEKLYNARNFPNIDGLKYQSIIYKCWTSQYTNVAILRGDYSQCMSPGDYGGAPIALWESITACLRERSSIPTALGVIGFGIWVWVNWKRR